MKLSGIENNYKEILCLDRQFKNIKHFCIFVYLFKC